MGPSARLDIRTVQFLQLLQLCAHPVYGHLRVPPGLLIATHLKQLTRLEMVDRRSHCAEVGGDVRSEDWGAVTSCAYRIDWSILPRTRR